jgi:hypothetical protein
MEDEEELREEARELPIKEALALLENKPYTPDKVTPIQRFNRFNKWLSSDTSVFAMKSAAAASVFATLSMLRSLLGKPLLSSIPSSICYYD